MIMEVYSKYKRYRWRPPVTYFGVTPYYDRLEHVRDLYRDDPGLNVIAADPRDPEPWCELASEGCFLWSWDLGLP